MNQNRLAVAGLSLIELVVTIAVSSIVMLAIMTQMNTTQKALKNTELTVGFNNLYSTLRMSALDGITCKDSFEGTILNGSISTVPITLPATILGKQIKALDVMNQIRFDKVDLEMLCNFA